MKVKTGLLAGEGRIELGRGDADLVLFGTADQRGAANSLDAIVEGVILREPDVGQRVIDAVHPQSTPQSPAGRRVPHPPTQREVQQRKHAPVAMRQLSGDEGRKAALEFFKERELTRIGDALPRGAARRWPRAERGSRRS